MVTRLWRYLLRTLAGVCIWPRLRMQLFRWSGVAIGRRAFVNMGVSFVDNYRGNAIRLGDRVAIAPEAMFLADSDPNESQLGVVDAFFIRGVVEIGDDTWIGARAVVLPNVRVGKCAIVGTGAVVTSDVEDYAIVAGVPARKIGDVREKDGWRQERL